MTATTAANGYQQRSRAIKEDARIHATADGRHIENCSAAGRSNQLIGQGIDGRGLRCPAAAPLLLAVGLMAHLPCHQPMIPDLPCSLRARLEEDLRVVTVTQRQITKIPAGYGVSR